MNAEGRAESAGEELMLASEELRAAEILLRDGFGRVALARIYFAVFHAVRALLYTEGLEPKSHRGALALFNRHFVNTGRFAAESARFVTQLQRFREEADYGESFIADDTWIHEQLADATRFVDRVSRETATG